MSIFKPWTWFQSEERKLREEDLRLRIQERSVRLGILEKKLEQKSGSDFDLDKISSKKPYKSLRLSGNTLTVVLNDGDVLMKDKADEDLYHKVRSCSNEKAVITMFFPNSNEEINDVITETLLEREMVNNNVTILKTHPEFVFVGKDVYLKGVNLPLPASVLGSFIEIEEKIALAPYYEEETLVNKFESLKMFWYWTALNPIENARRDLLSFVRQHDIKITNNGMLEMYRMVVSTGESNKDFINFISSSYHRVKQWKKSPADYCITAAQQDGEFLLQKNSINMNDALHYYGNLKDLYLELPNMDVNLYTDSHTRKKVIKIGEVYKEDESNIDLDNKVSCSNGLHVGSHEFGFNGFGDTGVLALVNPSKVRSVPIHDTNKMRVSEMFIAAVISLDDYKQSIMEDSVTDYSQEYFNLSVEQLEEDIKNSNLNCQENYVNIAPQSIDKIKELLKNKVTTF